MIKLFMKLICKIKGHHTFYHGIWDNNNIAMLRCKCGKVDVIKCNEEEFLSIL